MVMSKYVGETEKNSNRAPEATASLTVILLIDEADALLGKRTEIRNAHDR
jgi:SpoVK/Ycf46/Vps4 family AAA+-type ATPase